VKRRWKKSWHTLPIEQVYERLTTEGIGLRGSVAKFRLAEQGPNQLIAEKTVLGIFLAQFTDMMIWILIRRGHLWIGWRVD
jgi:magnesium-transporting ATPase (P-type)